MGIESVTRRDTCQEHCNYNVGILSWSWHVCLQSVSCMLCGKAQWVGGPDDNSNWGTCRCVHHLKISRPIDLDFFSIWNFLSHWHISGSTLLCVPCETMMYCSPRDNGSWQFTRTGQHQTIFWMFELHLAKFVCNTAVGCPYWVTCIRRVWMARQESFWCSETKTIEKPCLLPRMTDVPHSKMQTLEKSSDKQMRSTALWKSTEP